MVGVLAGPGVAQAASCRAWAGTQATDPDGSSGIDQFKAVAVASACEVWAVGMANQNTLIEHWAGGQSWGVVPSPSPGFFNELNGVAAVSGTDVWIVGDYLDDDGSEHPLLLHWDGSSLTQVATPFSTGELTAVTAVSANDVWVAGNSNGPLLAHYDGTSWTRMPSPAITPGGTGQDDFQRIFITGVTATSASDAWAVGHFSVGFSTVDRPLILHWDGTAWSQTPVPQITAPDDDRGSDLSSVSATSPADAWAVGGAHDAEHPVILHWDGQSWTEVPNLEAQGVPPTGLAAVTAVSADSAWAVSASGSSALLLHWDGRSWTRIPSPSPGANHSDLVAVSAGPAGIVWTAGEFSDQPFTGFKPAAFEFGVVPNVAGDIPSDAVTAVNSAGLATAASFVTTPGPTCSADNNGRVIGTSPPAGTFTAPPATLIICSLPTSVAVPDVLQFSDANARSAITGAGLTVGSDTMVASCTVARGDVVTQNPDPGTVVALGSAVSFTISTGKQPNGKPCISN